MLPAVIVPKVTTHEIPQLSPEPPAPPLSVDLVCVAEPEDSVTPVGRDIVADTSFAVVSPQFWVVSWIVFEPVGSIEGMLCDKDVTNEGDNLTVNELESAVDGEPRVSMLAVIVWADSYSWFIDAVVHVTDVVPSLNDFEYSPSTENPEG